MPSGFVKSLTEHAKELAGLQQTNSEEFIRLLKELRERLAGRLYNESAENIDAFVLRRVLRESESLIKEFERGAMDLHAGIAKRSIEKAVTSISSDVTRLARVFDGIGTNYTPEMTAILRDPAQELLLHSYESSVRTYGIGLVNGIRQNLILGMRSGTAYKEIINGIASKKGPLGEIGKAKAEQIVRTETSHIYGAAQHASLREIKKEVPSLKKTWLHIGSYKCPVCGPLHGTTRELAGDNSTWKVGKKGYEVAHPPAHPSCVCKVVGMKDSWRNKLKDLGYLEKQKEDDRPTL